MAFNVDIWQIPSSYFPPLRVTLRIVKVFFYYSFFLERCNKDLGTEDMSVCQAAVRQNHGSPHCNSPDPGLI